MFKLYTHLILGVNSNYKASVTGSRTPLIIFALCEMSNEYKYLN